MSFEFKKSGFSKSGKSFGKTGGFSMNGSQGDYPLKDVEYTGYLDEDLGEEMSALQRGFEDRAKKERKRAQNATDSGFWFAVYFRSREDKDAFLKAMQLSPKIYGYTFINGHKWARAKGIDLPSD